MDTATSLAFWTTALNLPDFRVAHLSQQTPTAPLCFTVLPVQEVGLCPRCGHACDTVHRRRHSDPVKDLPIGDRPVELILSIPQFHCQRCRQYFTPSYPAVADGAHATERFLAHAARLINFSDIANVAALYGVPERTLARWYYAHVERQRRQPPAQPDRPITSIGVDELSLKKSTDSSSP